MANLKVPGGSLYYDVQGEGEPLLILRGLGRSVRHWLGFDRRLAKQYKVITVDNRGIGRSTGNVSWDLTIFDMADDLAMLLKHLKIEKAHILGLSLGGMITLGMGIKCPDYCRSLAVINSSTARNWTIRLSLPAAYAMIRFGRDINKLSKELGRLLVGSGYPEDARERMIAEWKTIESEEQTPYLVPIKQILAAARFSVGAKLRTMAVPTLVIYGTDDLLVPPINSRKIHRLLPNAELVAIEGGGHEVMTDKPEELCRAIGAFFAKH